MDEIVARVSKVPLPQRILVLVVVVVVLVLANYMILISPKEEDIAKLQRSINQLENELVRKRAIARNLSRYRIEVERLKQRLNEALTLLPNEAEIPELLQKVAALVEQSDCEMGKFEPKPEVNVNFYARIPVEMEITGNYHSIAVFFDKVSKLARIVNVTDIKLGEPSIENQKVVLTANFMATTFKFVEAKAKADGATSTGFQKQ
ncbi:MAG: type 4a pilus biogenesis protein PilO [Myxococcota bacterium]